MKKVLLIIAIAIAAAAAAVLLCPKTILAATATLTLDSPLKVAEDAHGVRFVRLDITKGRIYLKVALVDAGGNVVGNDEVFWRGADYGQYKNMLVQTPHLGLSIPKAAAMAAMKKYKTDKPQEKSYEDQACPSRSLTTSLMTRLSILCALLPKAVSKLISQIWFIRRGIPPDC